MVYLRILFFLIFIGGCVPISDHPLTEIHSEDMDSSLYGTWFWKDKEGDDYGYMHVGLNRKTKLLRLISVHVRRDGELEFSDIPVRTSSLAGNKYLNLKLDDLPDDSSEKVKGYMLLQYKKDGDSLEFSWLQQAPVEKAIKDGVIRGIITKGEWGSYVRITEEQTKLQEFILEYDKDLFLFKEKQVFHRLNLPDMPSEPVPDPPKREGG